MTSTRKCVQCGEPLIPGQDPQKLQRGEVFHKLRLDGGVDGKVRRCDMCIDEGGASEIPETVTIDGMLAEATRKDVERKHKDELKIVTALENRVQRYLSELRTSLKSYDPTPLVIDPIEIDAPDHEWVLVLSDWHVGQQTRIEETGGMFYQDLEVTRYQVTKLWEAIEAIHEIERTGRTINKITVLALGDLVEGDDMRRSQHRKITDLVTVQTVQAFDLLLWLVRQLLTRFPEVDVEMVGGNHDRLSQKPGDGGLGELGYEDTMAWLMGEFLKRSLENDINDGRLAIKNWSTFFGYKTVLGKRLVFEHGCSFRWAAGGYGGVPYYAINNAGKKYLDMVGGADFVIMGHGHQAMALPNARGWLFMNGSFPPSSQYIQSSFKSILRPQQWLLSVHEKYGLTGTYPIYLDHPGLLQPGEIWKREEEMRALQDREIIRQP